MSDRLSEPIARVVLRLPLPPVPWDRFDDEPLLEVEPDAPGRRAASGLAAGREVLGSQRDLERRTVTEFLKRLEQLKKELQATITLAGGDGFRSFTASSLVADIDRLIAQATAELVQITAAPLNQALELGTAAVDEPLRGARIAVSSAPGLDRVLVQHAYDVTADLLTPTMQQFRTKVVAGVRRAAIAGAAPFDELRKLAGSIDTVGGFDNAQFQAERIMRTELGRVLNGATFARLQALARELPFLRKGWRAARDGRTRQGHLEAHATYARGSGIPVNDKFKINVYAESKGKPPRLLGVALLRYPIDPEATPEGRLAAGATIMCRCNSFVDFDLAELRAYSTKRSRLVPVIEPTPPPPEPAIVPNPEPAPPKVKRAKPELTPDQVRERLFKISSRGTDRIARLEQSQKVTLGAYNHAYTLETDIHGEPASAVQFDRLQAARAEVQKHRDELLRIKKAIDAERAAVNAAHRRLLEVPAGERVKISYKWASDRFGYVSAKPGGGSTPSEVKARFKKTITEVSRLTGHGSYGSKVLIDRAKDMTGNLVERAFANMARNSINLDENESSRVVAHELGHILEFNSPDMRAAILNFRAKRTAGEALEKLSKVTGRAGYGDHEVTRKDKFLDPYMGKDYGIQVTEILSMGIEYFYNDPLTLAIKDPEYFDFIFNLLRGKF